MRTGIKLSDFVAYLNMSPDERLQMFRTNGVLENILFSYINVMGQDLKTEFSKIWMKI